MLQLECELLLNRSHLKSYPYLLKVYPTNKCNLRCPLCHTGAGTKMWKIGLATGETPSGEMGLHLFQHLMDELSPYTVQVMLYGWGEPFLHPQIFEMISYGVKKNVGMAVTSNMTLLKPGDADRIIDSGLEHLTVSIDGTNQESYSTYRVGGYFEEVVANLRQIVEAKQRRNSKLPFIEWQFIVMRHNEHQMEEAKLLAKKWGVDVLRFCPVGINEQYEKNPKTWLPKNEKLSIYDYKTLKLKTKKKSGTCAWLYRVGVVSWDGSVAPCCFYNDNINSYFGAFDNNMSFQQIWNGNSFSYSRYLTSHGINAAKSFKGNVSANKFCTNCGIIDIRK